MFYIISILFVGTSFIPFILQNLSIWSAQGIWVQAWIMVAFSWSFFEKPKKFKGTNIPLGLLHLWIGLYTLVFCYMAQVRGTYDVKHFFPYFNFLCIVILYHIITTYLDRKGIEKILNMLRYVIIATLLMCTLQFFNLAQFFALLSDHHTYNNMVVGFLGNGTHLSGYLASAIPLFLWKGTREDYLALILLCIVLFFTGTTVNDPSISGFVIGIIVFLYFVKTDKMALITSVLLLVSLGIFVYKYIPMQFFSTSGRQGIWEIYFPLFHELPVTGAGLGTINMLYKHTSLPQVRFFHMEYAHFTFELGWIGLALIINMINSFFRVKAKDSLELALKAMVLGFLVSCCFNYPAHLWLPASTALFAYAGIYALRNKEIPYVI